jgi:hypothetical protein
MRLFDDLIDAGVELAQHEESDRTVATDIEGKDPNHAGVLHMMAEVLNFHVEGIMTEGEHLRQVSKADRSADD